MCPDLTGVTNPCASPPPVIKPKEQSSASIHMAFIAIV
jgi:hypothetical protein